MSGEAFYYISQRGEKAAAFMPQKVVEQRVIAVCFDKDRCGVTRLADYRLQDGKIFDFVSRTTPSGGSELSYLTYLFKIIGTHSAFLAAPRTGGDGDSGEATSAVAKPALPGNVRRTTSGFNSRSNAAARSASIESAPATAVHAHKRRSAGLSPSRVPVARSPRLPAP